MWFRSWEVTMMWKAVTEITGCDAICLHPHTQIGHCLCCVHKLILCVFRVSPSSPTPPCPYTHLEQTADHIDFELMKWHGWMMRLHLWRLNLNSIQIPVQASEKNRVFPLSHAGGFNAQLINKQKSHDRWQLSTARDMISIFWRRKAWEVLNIFLERTREGHHQWDEHWNCYKDNTEQTLRDGVAHTWGFPSA